LIVGQPAFRTAPATALKREGYVCTEVDEPYDAMVQLCRRPLFYSAVILSLNSLYREELQIIASIKRRFSHIEVWLSDTDGRQAALAEAVRLGADGFVGEDGLHLIAAGGAAAAPPPAASTGQAEPPRPIPPPPEPANPPEQSVDPLLTAEELRALLQEGTSPTSGQS
jgi:DNA-binding NarL/FixJ family response regulator